MEMILNSPEMAWERLGSMNDPGSQEDIVSLGLVKDVTLVGSKLTVELGPPRGDIHLHEALMVAIKRELSTLDGVETVAVKWPDPTVRDAGNIESVSAAVHLPILDNDGPSQTMIGMAPDSGYGELGPEQLPSPESTIEDDRWEEWPPVYQWEIDPTDPALKSGEERVTIGEWEYEIWWQEHPAGLIYAAIQALSDDPITAGPERPHPVGRNVVVNLVFDQRREAVVAVYGTARDFRPFVEAFRTGCKLERQQQENDA